MEVSKDKVVSISYELREGSDDGAIVEHVTGDQPLEFIFGSGNLLPKFEEQLSGLKEGENFEFGLNSEDAYGPVVENAIVDVPRSVFEVDGKIDENILQLGNMVPMMDNQGRRMNGKILHIGDEAVKMDFNHPMAGTDLHFKGSITGIREASQEELSHGHVHSGNHECGCGNGQEGGCDC